MNKKNFEVSNRKNDLFGFDPFFEDFFPSSFLKESRHGRNVMKTDIVENNDHYTLNVEVPGIKKEDIKISLDNGYLNVEASQNSNNDVKEDNQIIRKERFSGSYSRSFYVGDIDEKDITASMNDGVLKINVPKNTEKTCTKKYISINE